MGKGAESKLRLKAVDKMSAVIDRVKGKVPQLTRAVNRSARQFKIMQRRSESMTKSMTKMGKKMRGIGSGMSVGLTAPIVAFGALSLRTATQFQGSMNKVEALTGATGKSMEAMRKQALDLGASTQFSATQAADAMAFFGQAGFDANEILKATPATLALAAASSTDLATSADILSNVMGGFNVKADQAGKFADVLATVTARGNSNMLQLGEAMKQAAPIAQGFGATIEETGAFIAKLGDAGLQSSQAGNILKNMFTNLAAPGAKAKSIIKGLGIEVKDKVTGNLRTMTDVLSDMGKAFQSKGLDQAQKLAIFKEVFGKRSMAGAKVLINAVENIDAKTGVNSIQALKKELEGATGNAKKMAKTMQKGLPGAMISLSSAFESVQIAIFDLDIGGKKLSDRIISMADGVTNFFRSLSTTNKGLLKWIVIIGSVVAVIGPMIGAFGILLAIIPSMVTGFNLLVVGFGAIKLAAAGSLVPMLPMIAALGLLATAAFMIHKNWAPIKTFFSDLFTDPLQQLKDMMGFIGQLPGLSSIFGGDDTDAKLAAQGFNIKEASGKEAGSKIAVKESKQNALRQQKAVLDVNFSNMPKDTKVQADDRDNIIESLTGMMAIGG